ncbi:hypothetical protein BCR34DRAFT_588532 [Clohesyomyces aquaticus]|uniref:Uncharacterized protein n=1 Tax=Clohesyomyces aquaticus TaxID=1231657 RepID=A0A1Y1ZK08_9PLEO|nr:hypothetical protein BCR34DRAFT_588532 [Clohesyomyces aquaticus]
MSPYQHLFSANAVLNVFRNLRTANSRDQNDLLLTFQYQPEDVRFARGANLGKGRAQTETREVEEGDGAKRRGGEIVGAGGGGGGGSSIGFVVPWRSMQAQKRDLREREKELAEALVVLAGEVVFTDLPPTLQSSLSHNPLIQIRHLAAGISRQMSAIELQMSDNAAFATGKNLYTGGEIIRKFLPPIMVLFDQRPVPQRMIFELLMELKDLAFLGMLGCDREVVEWEVNGWESLVELDEGILRAVSPLRADEIGGYVGPAGERGSRGIEDGVQKVSAGLRRLKKKESRSELRRRESRQNVNVGNGNNPNTSHIRQPQPQHQPQPQSWLTTSTPTSTSTSSSSDLDPESEILYHLESLETTATALSHLPLPIDDFCAKSIITLRRMLDRATLTAFAAEKKRRKGRCAEYARCVKWGGMSWRQGGGCRRGCRNEDEDPESMPCWHRGSAKFEESGMVVLGGGR